jgi:hypothetical protein
LFAPMVVMESSSDLCPPPQMPPLTPTTTSSSSVSSWYEQQQQQGHQQQQQQQEQQQQHGDGSGSSQSQAELAAADVYFKGQQNYFSQMQQQYQGMHGARFLLSINSLRLCVMFSLFLASAQSQMMGRHAAAAAAGSFYSPALHSMWGSAFGNAKQYSAAGFPSSYAQTGKESPGDQQQQQQSSNNNNDESYSMTTSSAGGIDPTQHQHHHQHHHPQQHQQMDFKPPPESLIQGLPASAYNPTHMISSSRKLPEGSSPSSSSCSPPSTSYPYYSTPDLAASMYGSGFAGVQSGSTHRSSYLSTASASPTRSKPKNRSTAGEKGLSF